MKAFWLQSQISGGSFFGSSDDFMFLRRPDGLFAIGMGPFRRLEGPALDLATFYFNDFPRQISRPWIQPSRYFEAPTLEGLPIHEIDLSPTIEWRPPSKNLFHRLFCRIRSQLESGLVDKLVPVIVERGTMTGDPPEGMIREISSMSTPFYPYGIRIGSSGMIGASPEPIVSIQGNQLTAIALAGTVPSGGGHPRSFRNKEIREHRYVADFIGLCLNKFGSTRRGPTGPLDLGSVLHLMTTFETCLDQEPDIEELLDALHPSPAIGPRPRNSRTLQIAHTLRGMAGVPRAFGAPFGVSSKHGFHSVLTIRNVIWNGSDILLPAGCGIIRGSTLSEEWDELRLKRESVKTFLGLTHQASLV